MASRSSTPATNAPQIDYYTQTANRYGLLKSGGSDSHGDVEGARIGEYGIGYEAIEAMRARAAIYSLNRVTPFSLISEPSSA